MLSIDKQLYSIVGGLLQFFIYSLIAFSCVVRVVAKGKVVRYRNHEIGLDPGGNSRVNVRISCYSEK